LPVTTSTRTYITLGDSIEPEPGQKRFALFETIAVPRPKFRLRQSLWFRWLG
jgi:hypothetical protein